MIIKTIFIAVVVIVAALGGIKAISDKKEQNASAAIAKIYPIVVKEHVVSLSTSKITLPFLATVENDKDVKLSSRIAARVLFIKPSGSGVKKGEIVAKLDTTALLGSLNSTQKQLLASKVALQNQEAAYKRTQELLKVQGASIEQAQKEQTAIANIKAQLNSLKQKVIEIKNSLSYATIKSPVDGVVSKSYENVGSTSSPSRPLLHISSKNGFYLLVKVPKDIKMQGVELEGKQYPAIALAKIQNGLSQYRVYANSKNFTSGDIVQVDIVLFNGKGTFLPFDAILNRESKSYVLVVENDKATAKEVTIIQSGEQGVVIENSIENSHIVLAKPDVLLKLVSGHKLSIKE